MRWKMLFTAMVLGGIAVALQYAPTPNFGYSNEIMQTVRGWGGVVLLLMSFAIALASFFASRDEAPSLTHKILAIATAGGSLYLLTLLFRILG